MIKARISTKHSFGEKKEPSSLSELPEWVPVGASSPNYWVYFKTKIGALCVPTTANWSFHYPEYYTSLSGSYTPFPSGTVITMVQE